jgi:hypothetical protein
MTAVPAVHGTGSAPSGRILHPYGSGTLMDILLVIAILVLLLGVLGITGVIEFLRAGAWLILVIGALILLFALII